MKLYIQDEELLFDYSDVDTQAQLNKATAEYQAFLRESECRWEGTLKHAVKRLSFRSRDEYSALENAYEHRRLVGNAYCAALRLSLIEISESVKPFLQQLEEKCAELKQIEEAKRAERERMERWKKVCKYGCDRCANKRRWEDDYICAASGDVLPEKNMPGNLGATYMLFNFVPFPTENCPFNNGATE